MTYFLGRREYKIQVFSLHITLLVWLMIKSSGSEREFCEYVAQVVVRNWELVITSWARVFAYVDSEV